MACPIQPTIVIPAKAGIHFAWYEMRGRMGPCLRRGDG